MKGISAVLATVLIVVITVAIIGLAYGWATGLFELTSEAGEEQVESVTGNLQKSVDIIAIKCTAPEDNTKNTISEFYNILSEKGLINSEISEDKFTRLLKPSWIEKLQINNLLIQYLLSLSKNNNQGTAFFCSVTSAGGGRTTPLVITPRPRLFIRWQGNRS